MRIVKFALLLGIIITSSIPAQYMSSSQLSGIGVPFFHAGVFRSFSDNPEDSLRQVKVYFQINNDDLTFLKVDTFYTAEVEFDIYLSNLTGEFTFNRTLNKEIKTIDFDETNSRQITNTYETSVRLLPGVYDMVITALDKNNNKQVNRKFNFELQDFHKYQFLISDILFFEDYKLDSTELISSFNPNLTNNFGGSGKYFYFYISSLVKDPSDTLEIEYFIRNPAGIIVQFNQYTVADHKEINEHYIRINRQQFDQSRYELEVIAKYRSQVMKTKKLFSFFWTESPDSPQDLNAALDQMRYLPEADSIKWALKQPYKEKLAYFKNFWKRIDPNPGSEKNELMDEYYRRINVANQNFSTLSQNGWQTDRGRIFVKFGEPDDIERHPFEINSAPYEIWRFYDYRKLFLFIDRTGFGDFYLHPDYLNEEYN
jgi:GWxTD domain-containing protein